jgi:hypothetical protein
VCTRVEKKSQKVVFPERRHKTTGKRRGMGLLILSSETARNIDTQPSPATEHLPRDRRSQQLLAGRPRTSERGLLELFDTSAESNHIYTDADFNQISTYLRNTGQPDWSQVPRLYTVLRLIDGLDVLGFIEQGITDIWFPFGQTTLPACFLLPSKPTLSTIRTWCSQSLYSSRRIQRGHIPGSSKMNRFRMR